MIDLEVKFYELHETNRLCNFKFLESLLEWVINLLAAFYGEIRIFFI